MKVQTNTDTVYFMKKITENVHEAIKRQQSQAI